MKRIHLFEFEDLEWFPSWLRSSMTLLIVVMHKILRTPNELSTLLIRALPYSSPIAIVDLCSGSGGPIIKAHKIIRGKMPQSDIKLTLSDLYPDQILARSLKGNDNLSYYPAPVDALNIPQELNGIRTLIAGLHHMKPAHARIILKNAMEVRQPICILEISDNSYPKALWWLAIPFNFFTCLLITPFVKPLTWQQLVFTYLIPIIPLCFAWDGAVSNARTYTLDDMDLLLEGLHSKNYRWEKGIISGRSKMLYLLGLPNTIN